jgi:hypothetical protein
MLFMEATPPVVAMAPAHAGSTARPGGVRAATFQRICGRNAARSIALPS